MREPRLARLVIAAIRAVPAVVTLGAAVSAVVLLAAGADAAGIMSGVVALLALSVVTRVAAANQSLRALRTRDPDRLPDRA